MVRGSGSGSGSGSGEVKLGAQLGWCTKGCVISREGVGTKQRANQPTSEWGGAG